MRRGVGGAGALPYQPRGLCGAGRPSKMQGLEPPPRHQVWKLVAGLAESMRMLFWTVMVICVITYIFAIVGVVLISSE